MPHDPREHHVCVTHAIRAHMNSDATKAPRERYAEADAIRSLCMVYIIGFWHLHVYSPYLPRLSSLTGSLMFTYWCLGLFFFISGFLLAAAHAGMAGAAAILSFYARRAIRLYPPYVVALLSFYVFGICDVTFEQMVNSIVLVAMLVGDSPETLWFINLIILYYLATPFLICDKHRHQWWLVVVLLLGCLFVIHLRTNAIDIRVFQYAPSYAVGLLCGREREFRKRFLSRKGRSVGVILCAALVALGSVTGRTGTLAIWAVCPPLLAPAVWGFAGRIVRCDRVAQVFRRIGYLSFMAYLIHRIAFGAANQFFRPGNAYSAWVYWVGLVLPATLIAAFLLQAVYDRAVVAPCLWLLRPLESRRTRDHAGR